MSKAEDGILLQNDDVYLLLICFYKFSIPDETTGKGVFRRPS